MKKSSVRLFFMLLAVAAMISVVVSSCKHEVPTPATDNSGNGGNGGGGNNTNPCDSDSVYFAMQILPLFQSNCAMSGCHSASNPQDGVNLTSYQAVMNSGVISAGSPGNSDLYEAITETDPDKIMPPPPRTPLTSQQIQMIQTWIQQGARNLYCDGGCDTTNVTWTNTIRPLINLKCVGCHQGASPGGNYDLSTHAGVAAVAANGKLMGAVRHLSGFSAMPKNQAKLPQCDIDKLQIWVNDGAPNN